MAQAEKGAGHRRPHHISSIAHLFLQDDAPSPPTEKLASSIDVVVASPGETPVSACAAAGLTLGAPCGVSLIENIPLRWSAAAYFPDGEGAPSVTLDPALAQSRLWRTGDGGQTLVSCYHLGCLRPDSLAQLEAMAESRSLGELKLNGVGGLVWCLLQREVGRLSSSYTLGRLAEMVTPQQLQILVFPDGWGRAGSPGWLDEIQRVESPEDSAGKFSRCLEQARLVCGSIPMAIGPVSGLGNMVRGWAGENQGDSLWRELAARMVAGGIVS